LDKDFNYDTEDYTLSVPEDAETVEITTKVKSDDYVVAYNGTECDVSGGTATGTVDISSIDSFDVTVTAGTGDYALTMTYTITIERQVDDSDDVTFNVNPSDATIEVYDQNGSVVSANSDGTYSGLFATYEYTYTISKDNYVPQSGTIPSTGGTIDITLEEAPGVTFNVNPSDAIVKVYDADGNEVEANDDGAYIGLFAEYEYTYTVTKYGYVSQSGTISSTGGTIDVTLEEAADDGLTDVSAYWSSFAAVLPTWRLRMLRLRLIRFNGFVMVQRSCGRMGRRSVRTVDC
jgi:hypothetical protein